MPIKRSSLNRDSVIKYIEATLLGGVTKKEAYTTHINPHVKNPNGAITVMENKKEFIDIYQMIFSDDALKMKHTIQRVQTKFVGLVEKNIDTTSDILDAAKKTKDLKIQVGAVKLANETIGAMAVIQTTSPAGNAQPRLNRGSAVI